MYIKAKDQADNTEFHSIKLSVTNGEIRFEENGEETLMGKVFHNHVKQYQQMYDRFEYI